MTQYDVTFGVGELTATRSLTLLAPTEEEAIKELKRRGLVNSDAEVTILAIEERFGLC
ncbi:MAG: hypothetical protein SPK09_03235 [Porphyromonas sp.]|nr:hypothetical protein [Porphyromonas sp.]